MNTDTTTSEFLLLFRGTDWCGALSPEQMQKVVGQFGAWFDRLTEQGKVKTGHPLAVAGKIVSGKSRSVADGPFAESKEAIGGYFLIEAESLDEAVALAKGCPSLDYGASVEVRAITPECPLAMRAAEELAQATA